MQNNSQPVESLNKPASGRELSGLTSPVVRPVSEESPQPDRLVLTPELRIATPKMNADISVSGERDIALEIEDMLDRQFFPERFQNNSLAVEQPVRLVNTPQQQQVTEDEKPNQEVDESFSKEDLREMIREIVRNELRSEVGAAVSDTLKSMKRVAVSRQRTI